MKTLRSGFTIVELLIVIVVIGVLAGITVVAYNGVQARAVNSEKASEVKTINQKLQLYKVDNGFYPCVDDLTGSNTSTVLGLPVEATRPSNHDSHVVGLYGGNADVGTNGYRYITYENGVVKNTGQCASYTLGYWNNISSTAVEYNGN